jgi:endonuclease III
MTVELVKALLLIAKVCMSSPNCEQCKIKDFCGKMPSQW